MASVALTSPAQSWRDAFERREHTLAGDKQMRSYSRPGTGAALVLIPGTWGSVDRFETLIARLPDDVPVVVVELCWQAGLVPPQTDLSIEETADDVLRVISELGLARFHLAGHSIGAMIAIEIAGRDIAGLVGAIPMEGWTHHTVVQTAFEGIVTTKGTPEVEAQRAEAKARSQAHLTEDQCKAIGQIWKRWNGYPCVERSKVPQCHIWGDRGKPRQGRAALQIPDNPQIQVAWIGGASHAMLTEAPDAVADVVLCFLKLHP